MLNICADKYQLSSKIEIHEKKNSNDAIRNKRKLTSNNNNYQDETFTSMAATLIQPQFNF